MLYILSLPPDFQGEKSLVYFVNGLRRFLNAAENKIFLKQMMIMMLKMIEVTVVMTVSMCACVWMCE
jgi:hypothetical protein